MKNKFTRRGMLKAATAAGLLGVVGQNGAFAKPVSMPENWSDSADIVIVGAGAGGLAAAVEALDNGLSVIVLESQPLVGGSSTICGGGMAFAGTDMQKAQGISDSNELFLDDLLTVGNNENDPELIKAFLNVQLEHYNWLKEHGVVFKNIVASGGMTVPRQHNVDPAQLIQVLKEYVTNKGGRIILNTAAERLVNDQGTIVGVIANRRKKAVSYQAKKAVLLAAGGYVRAVYACNALCKSDCRFGLPWRWD